MKRFATIGISHKFAPLEVRECLAIPDGSLAMALRRLREDYGVPEACIVSTCNRVEFYTFGSGEDARQRVLAFLCDWHHLEAGFFEEYLYEKSGLAAVEHAFRVVASLDSLVLGETQILNQFKTAYQVASSEGCCGKALNSLMHRAFAVAKDVRARTSISHGQLSIASVAVRFIRRTFEQLGDKTALLIGLGEMGRLTLQHLRDQGVGSIIIANRTLEKARQSAESFGAAAIPLDLIADYLPRADIVVSQTSAPGTIIKTEDVAAAMKKRRYAPMFFVDLAVPRDIPTEIDRIDGVYRYVVDDLERVVHDASDARQKEVDRCQRIINEHVEAFVAGFRTFTVEPLIGDIKNRTDALIQHEIQRASARLNSVLNGDAPHARDAVLSEMEQAVRRVANKLLHGPLRELKDDVRQRGNEADAVSLIERMFLQELRSDKELNSSTPVSLPPAKSDSRDRAREDGNE